MVNHYCDVGVWFIGLWFEVLENVPTVQALELITVTTTNDELNNDGDCSLREAIQAANQNTAVDNCPAGVGVDTIFIPEGVYHLTLAGTNEDNNQTGDFDLLEDVFLVGQAMTNTIIHAQGVDRVLHLPNPITVALTDLTLRSGSATIGGGLSGSGHLTLTNTLFWQNGGAVGGAIAFENGTLWATHTTFSQNSASAGGGVDLNNVQGYFDQASFLHNSGNTGGGLYALGGELSLNQTIFDQNAAGLGIGGGLFVSGPITLSQTTIQNNSAHEHGGGAVLIGPAVVQNSVIMNNHNNLEQGGVGGGIFFDGPAVISQSSFMSNSSSGPGGGAYFVGYATVEDTLFAYNDTPYSPGGGAFFEAGSLVKQSSFVGNFSNEAAAHFGGQTHIEESHFTDNELNGATLASGGTIISSTFTYNTGTLGGGLRANAPFTISHSLVASNTAEYGGGAYFEGSSSHISLITDTQFLANHSSGTGGGMVNVVNTAVQIQNSQFLFNTAENGGGLSSGLSDFGIYEAGPLAVQNCLLVGNEAILGGQAYLHDNNREDTVTTLEHLTIVHPAGGEGSAIVNYGQGAILTNTLIASYTIGLDAGNGHITEDYTMFSGVITPYLGVITPGLHSFTAAAEFADQTFYRLTPDSPAVDAGAIGVAYDFEGDERELPDIGWDEFVDEPLAGLTAVNSSPTILGYHTTFTATLTAGSQVSYSWDFGDGQMGTGAITSHQYGGAGVFTAVVTATNSLGSLVTETVVIVEDEPIGGVTIGNSSPTPLGQTTFLTAAITSGSNVSYLWDFGDGQSGIGASLGHVYEAVGQYTATFTASNSFGVFVTHTLVLIEDVPITGLTVTSNSPIAITQTAYFTAGVITGTNISYSWDFGDGQVGVGLTTSHVYTAAGLYTVTVTATNSNNTQVVTTSVLVTEATPAGRAYLPLLFYEVAPQRAVKVIYP